MDEMKQSVTVKLLLPVQVEGATITELTFRRMKVKDTLVSEDEIDETKAGIRLFARLAGVSVAVIEELDMEDFVEIGEKVTPMMGKRAAEMLKSMQEKASLGAT